MAGQVRPYPYDTIDFVCHHCGHRWHGPPARSNPCEERPWHPWEYHATCPQCDTEDCPQQPRQLGLFKAWGNATGPKTVEGKAKCASNLPEKVEHSEEGKKAYRFNRLTTGLSARTATFFPAKPGKYPHCKACHYYAERPGDAERPCVEFTYGTQHKNPEACLKRTELFMQHHIAFESGNPSMLTGLRADTQAALQAIVDDMILAIAADGVRIRTPQWYSDKDGNFHLAMYEDDDGNTVFLQKMEEHPLLGRLIQYIDKNNLTLSDMGMTPKVVEENNLLRGHLEQDIEEKESDAEYRQAQLGQLQRLEDLIANSRQRTQNDPVLVEYQQEHDDG